MKTRGKQEQTSEACRAGTANKEAGGTDNERGEGSPGSKRSAPVLNIALIAVFIAAVIYVTIMYGPEITALAKEPEKLRKLLNSFGWRGVLVFIGIQILQVVVAAIPGEAVQIAGGYIYGTFPGTLYSMTGIFLGSVIVFAFARIIGYPVVRMAVSEAQIERFSFMINSSKSEAAMFILFLIPGIPKDFITYIAGITPVKPLRFMIIILIGRFPALLGSSYIGHSTQKGNYTVAILLSVAAVILFITGLLHRERIINKIHQLTQKNK